VKKKATSNQPKTHTWTNPKKRKKKKSGGKSVRRKPTPTKKLEQHHHQPLTQPTAGFPARRLKREPRKIPRRRNAQPECPRARKGKASSRIHYEYLGGGEPNRINKGGKNKNKILGEGEEERNGKKDHVL